MFEAMVSSYRTNSTANIMCFWNHFTKYQKWYVCITNKTEGVGALPVALLKAVRDKAFEHFRKIVMGMSSTGYVK